VKIKDKRFLIMRPLMRPEALSAIASTRRGRKSWLKNSSILVSLLIASNLILTTTATALHWGQGLFGGNNKRYLPHPGPIPQHWGQGPLHNWGRGPFGGHNGRSITKGLQGVSTWVSKHPWEVVIGVAAVAGGGYLIFAQGYVLSLTAQGVTVVSITTGTTSGIAVGSGLLTGGAVAAAYLSATGNSYTPGSGAAGSDQTTLEFNPQAPEANNPLGTAAPISNGPSHNSPTPKAPPPQQSQAVPNAPSVLSTTATVSQRFSYAFNVSQWVDAHYPLNSVTFDKEKLSPPEEQLIKAIIALGEIKDTDDDIAARKQAEEMDDWSNLPKEELIHKMGEELLKVTFGHFAENIYSLANDITPVQLTEGDALLRDSLIKQLFDKLDNYEQKRKGMAGPTWAQPVSPNWWKPRSNEPELRPN
jgi:hypothetical protein